MEVETNTIQHAIDHDNEVISVNIGSELSKITEIPTELSQTSELAADIKNLVFNSEPSCSGTTEISSEYPSESSSVQSSTTETSCSSIEDLEVIKNKRKRKRKRKKKQPKAAETIPVPFPSRYKRFKKTIIPISAPKVHIRFDDTGNLDVEHSEFNRKPKIIRILETNLLINENLKQRSTKQKSDPEIPNSIDDNIVQAIVASISLKPRIIKAIII